MNAPKICEVAGCGRPARAKCLCTAHYTRMLRRGDPLSGFKSDILAWFEAHKDHDGAACLIWPFGRKDGYGAVWVDGKAIGAHVYMCTLAHGEKPFPKAEARHFKCGRGDEGCVNPTHICWGTHAENMNDKIIHGVASRLHGERNGRAKLDDPTVALVRADHARGMLVATLASELRVSKSTIYDIVNGTRWS
jgi:hypothetical protein